MSTILITGAGRGLGYELARQYAAEGWRVIGTVRNARAKLPASVERQIADVTDRRQVGILGKALRGVPLDVLFCNAGISGKRGMALGSFDYDSWEEVLRVNLLGAAAVTEALLPNILAGERKVIAMMSSRLGSIGEASGMTLPYAKGLAATLASKGVIVIALSPGWVRTDMGGGSAPLAPETSVAGLRPLIAGLKQRDSGRFLSHDGSPIPW